MAPKSSSLPWPDSPPWMGHFAVPGPDSDPGTRRPESEPGAAAAGKRVEDGVVLLRRPCPHEGPAGWAR